MGKSEGLYYKNAELFTYAAIAQTHPDYIHDNAKAKVPLNYYFWNSTILNFL